LQIHFNTYACLFFGQSGGDGFIQAIDDLTPQGTKTIRPREDLYATSSQGIVGRDT